MNNVSNQIIALIEQARQTVVRNTNTTMILTYYHIGRLLVEEWQQGERKAEYGAQLLASVSADLTKTFGKGFSADNLERMRKFFLLYSNSSSVLRNSDIFQKTATVLRISDDSQISASLTRKFDGESEVCFLPISWTHYSFLMRIKDETERQFYEVESFLNQWSVKELERQFNTGLFERLAMSRNKSEIMRLAKEGQIIEHPNDLKIGKLKHQDLGQMQMYVNYYDRFVKQADENSTIGIVVCKTKENAIVEITLPEDNRQIFASQYETVLPSKKQLIELLKTYPNGPR